MVGVLEGWTQNRLPEEICWAMRKSTPLTIHPTRATIPNEALIAKGLITVIIIATLRRHPQRRGGV